MTSKTETFEIPDLSKNLKSEEKPDSAKAIEPKKSITEIQEQKDLSKYNWVCLINTDTTKHLLLAIESEKDYKQGNWHHIPRSVSDEHKIHHNNKKVCVEIYCINDKDCLNRLTKIIKRYYPVRKVEWDLINNK